MLDMKGLSSDMNAAAICPQKYQSLTAIMSLWHRGAFCYHGLTSIPLWVSSYMHHKVRDEITYPFPNFNGTTIEVWEWIHNLISHFTGYMITYPCCTEKLVHVMGHLHQCRPTCGSPAWVLHAGSAMDRFIGTVKTVYNDVPAATVGGDPQRSLTVHFFCRRNRECWLVSIYRSNISPWFLISLAVTGGHLLKQWQRKRCVGGHCPGGWIWRAFRRRHWFR